MQEGTFRVGQGQRVGVRIGRDAIPDVFDQLQPLGDGEASVVERGVGGHGNSLGDLRCDGKGRTLRRRQFHASRIEAPCETTLESMTNGMTGELPSN